MKIPRNDKNVNSEKEKFFSFGNFENIAWRKLFDKKGLELFFSASGPLLMGIYVCRCISMSNCDCR
jgi:hypothetical protein